MLGWSMNLFRVRGIRLAVHFSFPLLLAVNAFSGYAESGGWEGAFWYTAVLLAFFVCVVLHEFGHSFTAMHFGIGVRRILLMPIGGMAEFESIPREPRREVLITLAGPAVNFLIAGVLWLVLPKQITVDNDFLQGEAANLLDFGQLVMKWNLIMGCFNFLPAFPMDGGRILRALLATRFDYLRATLWAASIAKVVSGLACLSALYFELWIPAALFAFIFVVGEMEYRALARHERDEAHWQATFARIYGLPPSTEEPPLLTR